MKSLKKIILLTLAIFALSGPNVLKAEKIRVHTIKKGEHTSTNRCIRLVGSGQIRLNFFVDQSWLYDEKAPGFQSGWNKLIGIADGFNQHKNSVRIGWRCIENKIYLCSYCYVNGERIISDMFEAPMGWNSGSVSITDNNYRVLINNTVLNVERTAKSPFKIMLYPYFGGNSTAPHEMEFRFRLDP